MDRKKRKTFGIYIDEQTDDMVAYLRYKLRIRSDGELVLRALKTLYELEKSGNKHLGFKKNKSLSELEKALNLIKTGFSLTKNVAEGVTSTTIKDLLVKKGIKIPDKVLPYLLEREGIGRDRTKDKRVWLLKAN